MALDVLPKPETEARSKIIAYPAERRFGRASQTAAFPAEAPIPAITPKENAAEPKPAPRRVSLEIVSGLLRGVDAVAALAAGYGAFVFAEPDLPMLPAFYILTSLFGALVVANLLHLFGTYQIAKIKQVDRGLGRVLLAWILTAVAVGTALKLSGTSLESNATWMMLWLVIGLAPPVLVRVICAACIERWRRAGRLQHRVAIVGSGPIGQRLLRRINAEAQADIIVTGVYDDRLSRLPESCMGHKVRGSTADLIEDIRRQHVDTVVVALPLSAERRLNEVMTRLRQVAVDVCLCPDQFGFQLAREGTQRLGGVTLLCAEERPLRNWRGVVKEVEDRVFAAMILVAIAPLLLAIAVLIKLDSPGPVLFRQKRYGLNNRLIEVWKFRTMHHHATDQNAEQLTRRNDPRVTRIGAFLRRTSLDELPQFINVLCGDMSVVGPRPHALAAKAGGLLYQDAVRNYDSRHRMKPGITGWAQVNGWRGETETVDQIVKRVEHDLHYVENWSVRLDVIIILRTIFGGFTGKQAY